MTLRDRLLLELAGTAAVEGRQPVALNEDMITELEAAAGGPARVLAPHFEGQTRRRDGREGNASR
jgi:lantibiotic biosynthesis protein